LPKHQLGLGSFIRLLPRDWIQKKTWMAGRHWTEHVKRPSSCRQCQTSEHSSPSWSGSGGGVMKLLMSCHLLTGLWQAFSP